MKTNFKFNAIKIFILNILIFFCIHLSLSAQQVKNININLNVGTFSLGENKNTDNFTTTFYLAPSLKRNRSEFILGPFWSKKVPGEYTETYFTPGLLAGYRLDLIKDSRWLQFSLQYMAEFVQWSGHFELGDHFGNVDEFNWNEKNLNQFVGYGIILYLTRNKSWYLSHSFGYSRSRNLYSSHYTYYNDPHGFLSYTAGIGFRIFTFK